MDGVCGRRLEKIVIKRIHLLQLLSRKPRQRLSGTYLKAGTVVAVGPGSRNAGALLGRDDRFFDSKEHNPL
jgi:hypothetical protein